MHTGRLVTISTWISRATVGLLPLVVLPQVIYPFVFGKTLFLSVMTIALLVMWAVLLIYPEYRKRIGSICRQPITMALIVLVGAAYLSSILGINFGRSFWGTQERGTGLLMMSQMLVWYILTRATHTTAKSYTWLIRTIAMSGFVASLIALVRLKGIVIFGVDTGLRISGTLANPIFFAGILIFYVSFALYGAVTEKNNVYKWAYILLALFQTVIIFLTQTRSVALAVIAGAMTAGVIAVIGASSTKRRRQIAMLCISGVLLLLCAYAFRSTIRKNVPAVGRIFSTINLQDNSLVSRLAAWESGWNAFKERPVLGWGQEAFVVAFDVHYNPSILNLGFAETRFDRAHNLIVELLVTGGILGLLAYAAVILIFVGQLIRSKLWSSPRGIIAISALAAMFAHLMFSFNTPSSWILFLVLMLLYEKPLAEDVPRAHTLQLKQKGVLAAACVVGVIGAYHIAYLPMKESATLIETVFFASTHSRVQAVPRFRTALDIPTPYVSEARNEFVKNVIRGTQEKAFSEEEVRALIIEAESLGRDNIVAHPYDSYYQYLNGILYYTARDLDVNYITKSIEYLETAIEMSQRQQYLFALAELYVQIGQENQAMQVYKKAVDLSPDVGISHWYYGLSLLTVDNVDDAKQALRSALELGYSPLAADERKLTAQLLHEHEIYDLAAKVYYALMYQEEHMHKAQSWAELAIYMKDGGYYKSAEHAAREAAIVDPTFAVESQLFIETLEKIENDEWYPEVIQLAKDRIR